MKRWYLTGGLLAMVLLLGVALVTAARLFTAPGPVTADRQAAGLGLVIAGEYLTLVSPQNRQIITGPVQVEAVLTNPDPDYRLSLTLYVPNPPGLRYRQGSATPISKILDTTHLSSPSLPSPVKEGEVVQGAVWDGEVLASSSLTLTLEYDLTAPLPPTVILRAIAYDGLAGTPVDEASLVFMTRPGQPLPAPTPRYSLTPVAVPALPAGRVFSPTMAVNLQSSSFQSHDRAVQGLDRLTAGSNLMGETEAVYPYKFRVLSLTQCYFLNTYTINRAVLEFDTTPVPAGFHQAILRLRALPPNPGGHTIEVYRGEWDWVLGQAPNAEGLVVDTVNPAVWSHPPTPLTTLPVMGTTAIIPNLPLPRAAIAPGGVTRLLLTSSDEADTPPAGSCFTGGPAGLGGALTLPELYIQ